MRIKSGFPSVKLPKKHGSKEASLVATFMNLCSWFMLSYVVHSLFLITSLVAYIPAPNPSLGRGPEKHPSAVRWGWQVQSHRPSRHLALRATWLASNFGWLNSMWKKNNRVFHGARAFALIWKCSKSLPVPLPSPRNPLRKRVTRSAATCIALRTSRWAALGCSTAQFVVMEPPVKHTSLFWELLKRLLSVYLKLEGINKTLAFCEIKSTHWKMA